MDKMKPFEYGMVYPKTMKDAWVGGYLNNPENYNKNFVQRIREGTANTKAFLPTQDGGSRGTHLMSSGSRSVYPLIEQTENGLRRLPRFQMPADEMRMPDSNKALIMGWNEYKRNNQQDFGYKDPTRVKTPYADWLY
jgi:hypothetical protein